MCRNDAFLFLISAEVRSLKGEREQGSDGDGVAEKNAPFVQASHASVLLVVQFSAPRPPCSPHLLPLQRLSLNCRLLWTWPELSVCKIVQLR